MIAWALLAVVLLIALAVFLEARYSGREAGERDRRRYMDHMGTTPHDGPRDQVGPWWPRR